MFQHTAARRRLAVDPTGQGSGAVSTHSRPKAAEPHRRWSANGATFQHTAARRRLERVGSGNAEAVVSTHSRPKAAVD